MKKPTNRNVSVAVVCAFSLLSIPRPALPATIAEALARAYSTNPELNQQRVTVRIRDEDISRAWSGLRPLARIEAGAGAQRTDLKLGFPPVRSPLTGQYVTLRNPATGQPISFPTNFTAYPRDVKLSVSQPLFDGGRTESAVLQAESNVFAARSAADLSEQSILQDAVKAYMNVLRDTAVLSLRKNYISVLKTQLDHTLQKFQEGDLTSTDVAQAEASLAQARSELAGAQAQLKNSLAVYEQIIGDPPGRLDPASSIERLLPKKVEDAILIATNTHPSLDAARHQVDAADFAVQAAWSGLAPRLSLDGQLAQQYDSLLALRDAVLATPNTRDFTAAVRLNLDVPLYQRGEEFAAIRQAKEVLGREKLNLDLQRRAVRAAVISSYGQLSTAISQTASDAIAIKAAEAALRGVREEAKVGNRTTLDVLNAQQSLLNARVNLIISQRDRVVASYAALSALGRLTAKELKLDVQLYDPTAHFERVKNKMIGVDGDD
ncbi:Outer membrane efflux protein BepC [freshwater sediment metagenome]|uniref:Outer membrane efflux protein BepC n=1 Tax=freshwater sediment metagenome TaxID=556182 RepID=A0AA48M098_9ZZZZ